MFWDYPFKTVVQMYINRHNCKGEMVKVEKRDSKTLIYTLESELGPWSIVLQETSNTLVLNVNGDIYHYVDPDTGWEYLTTL